MDPLLRKNRVTWLAPLFGLVVCFFWLSAAQSQEIWGTLRGTVHDPSGAIVVGATVTLTNESTGVSRSTTTDSNGDYVFTKLFAGEYTVVVEHSGFRKYQAKGITVRLARDQRFDVSL